MGWRPADAAGPLPSIRQEVPVLEDGPSVELDDARAAQVFDEVPMERRLVLPTTFRVGTAESQVDRAADLLVEQDVADEAVDAKIDADAEFTDPSCAAVDGQNLLEKFLA